MVKNREKKEIKIKKRPFLDNILFYKKPPRFKEVFFIAIDFYSLNE